jgi:hypothetical protein
MVVRGSDLRRSDMAAGDRRGPDARTGARDVTL